MPVSPVRVRNLVGVAIALVLVMSGFGCATIQKIAPSPSAHVTGVTLENANLTGFTLDFALEVENPYAVSLPIVGLDYALSSGGEQFLSGSVEETRSIPAHEKGTIDLPLTVPYSALAGVVASIRPGAELPLKADLGLGVDTPVLGRLRIPIQEEKTVRLPSFP